MSKEYCFNPGDFVVYPTHGVGKVVDITQSEVGGQKLELIAVNFDKDRMTMRIPMTSVGKTNLRPLSSKEIMDAALENADITLLAGNISKLESLFTLSYAVSRNIKQNLFLAFAYNALIIPLAAGAFYNLIHWQFNPVVSSIAMSGSCLLVVGNALRLWRLKLK